MKRLLLICALLATPLLAQVPKDAEKNAALRYWLAFMQMTDQTLNSSAEAKHLEEVAKGTAPWDEAFGKLLDDNAGAVETMVVGTGFPYCEWGWEYRGGDKRLLAAMPIPDIGRGRALERLNVLTARRLAAQGKSREATDHLIAGVRFARDLGAGAPLIGVLVAASSLEMDLNASLDLARGGKLSAQDRQRLKTAVHSLSPGITDWSHAIHIEALSDHEILSEMKNSPNSPRLTGLNDASEALRKYPHVTDSDLREVDAIFAKAETLFREPAAASADGIAELAKRIDKLTLVAKMEFPSLKHINDNRAEFEQLLKKFQAEM